MPLPPLWRRDVEAGAMVVDLLCGADPVAQQPLLTQRRQELVEADDIELLPLLDAATVLASRRPDREAAGPDDADLAPTSVRAAAVASSS